MRALFRRPTRAPMASVSSMSRRTSSCVLFPAALIRKTSTSVPDGKQIYISNEDEEAVSIVDIASGTVAKTLKVGAQPEGVKVTPDGKHVWVTSEETGTIAVLDPVAGKIVSHLQGRSPASLDGLHARRRARLRQRRERWNGGSGGCEKVSHDQGHSAGQARPDQANGGIALTGCQQALRQHRQRAPRVHRSTRQQIRCWARSKWEHVPGA